MVYFLLLTSYFLLFSYLSHKNLKNGLYLICALLPAYLIRFTVFGLPATLLEGMIVILFIIWLVKSKLKTCPERSRGVGNLIPNILHLPIILLLAASTISIFVAPNLQAAAGIWKAYFIEPLMFLLIFVYNIKTSEEIKKAIQCLGLTALAIGIFAIIQKLTGALIPNPFWADEATRRITTFFGYPNANALFLVPVIFLTLGNLAQNSKFKAKNFFDILIIALSVLTIVWTKSVGALIGLAVGLIAWLIFYKKTRLATLLIILIVSIYAVTSPLVQQKIQKTYVSVNEIHLPIRASDFQIRAQQWRETLAMMIDTPIFGAGLAGYQTLVAPYHQNKHLEIYLYPHNFFLNFWTETGLLGLMAIIWILVIFFHISYIMYHVANTNQKMLTLAIINGMIALLVYGLVDVPYFKNDLAVLFWIMVGIIIVLNNQKSFGRVA